MLDLRPRQRHRAAGRDAAGLPGLGAARDGGPRPGRPRRCGSRAGSTRWRNISSETLDQEERVRLKLLNPLNVGLRLAARYKEAAFERLKLLSQDIEALQSIDAQLALFHQEMLRDFEPRLARLDLLLSEMEGRGVAVLRGDHPARPHPLAARQRGDQAARSSGRSSATRPSSSRRRSAGSSTGSSSATSRSGRT